ncbi:site-specific DNA-methyltransferase, partial [Stenotrophomonas sp.]|uniref:site-specific DNA-methyltransferase n=1 Tax=Stenotrophomonas sp. TaxID=69392 RepID=UPI00374D653A
MHPLNDTWSLFEGMYSMPLLNWSNRDEDLTRSALTPYRLLEPVASLSYGEVDSPNMLIEGDNLDALKALLPYYAGQVKCIFIDPPYNTRSAFDHYDDNLEHAKWLSMMYPRLELLRDLLAEDGSIWITLDDNEAHYFKVIADEVFGRKNFIANAIWQKVFSPKNSARHLSVDHDHLFVYAKDADIWRPNDMPRSERQTATYKNPDEDPRGPWTSGDLSARNFYGAGTYPITCPSGRVGFTPVFTDTYEKADQGHEECSCRSEGSSAPSS